MKSLTTLFLAAIITFFTQCNELKKIPTNTSGGLFSLNGNWQLTATSDNTALTGTVVQVFPGVTDGTVRTLGNNTLCLRERDVMWRNLKAGGSGVFGLEALASACNNTTVYQAGTLTAVNNDEIRITTKNANNTEVTQTWQRVRNQ